LPNVYSDHMAIYFSLSSHKKQYDVKVVIYEKSSAKLKKIS